MFYEQLCTPYLLWVSVINHVCECMCRPEGRERKERSVRRRINGQINRFSETTFVAQRKRNSVNYVAEETDDYGLRGTSSKR